MNENYLKNIQEIKKRYCKIYYELEKSLSDESYLKVEKSKNEEYLIPILKNGKACHSKYSHINESARMFNGNEETVLFCGIGGGYNIEYFLSNFPNKKALICEATYASLKRILELCDLTKILSNKNVILLPCIEATDFVEQLIQNYIPILMGNLSIKKIKVWEEYFYDQKTNLLEEKIKNALDIIKQDVSTQARFGKIWMRNILLNLKIRSKVNMKLPVVDNQKTAFILGAGPSLENAFEKLKRRREEYTIFACDASFMPLLQNDISPDFFISIDPQVACSTHRIFPFSDKIIAVFDICANASLVRQFFNNGNPIIFTTGQHPFAQYIYDFSIFPKLDVSAGTVAIAALNVAFSLGFTKFAYEGLDFAYTNGKAYSKGVYLSQTYQKNVSRIKTEETFFSELIFRTSVKKVKTKDKITYKTKLLDSYKKAFDSSFNKGVLWKEKDFSNFNYEAFIKKLFNDMKTSYKKISFIFLPLLAWEKLHNSSIDIEKDNGFSIAYLVLKEIFMI
ncbi:MAG: motility associated factor glycosyltransferase family protein [Treponema sp.]